jgi:hypothetical protein
MRALIPRFANVLNGLRTKDVKYESCRAKHRPSPQVTCLMDINTPTGIVEEVEEELSEIEDLKEDLGGVQSPVMV